MIQQEPIFTVVSDGDPWGNFLRARAVLLHAWKADGVSAGRMAQAASLHGPEHVERILSATAVVQGPLEGLK